MSEEKAKRDLAIRRSDSGVEVDFINRRVGHRGAGTKLRKVTIVFPIGDATKLPDWFITPAANLTFIRFQDASRALTDAEKQALEGHKFDAQQFWAERQSKKSRGPVAVNPTTEAKRVLSMTEADQLVLLADLAKTNPAFAGLMKQALKK